MASEFENKRIVVMGLGRFGGCIGAARWLAQQAARVRVTDLAGEDTLADSLSQLQGLPIDYRLGWHDEADLDGCDLLVVSPAVDKRKSAFFRTAVDRGIPWTSEMNLFLERCRGRVIGVTGTVGKSTTTAMIGAVLDAAQHLEGWRHGRVRLGGNIGKSLLDELPAIEPADLVVLELSSFQLEDAASIGRSPHIALLTNIRQNHLDRHGTMEAYARAKANIFAFQTADDWALLPADEDLSLLPNDWNRGQSCVRFGVDPRSGDIRFTDERLLGDLNDSGGVTLSLPGVHNRSNAAGAALAARILGVPAAAIRSALGGFRGLAHRLEFVGEVDGVRYFNDSKATTPDAAMTSLAAFDEGVIVLVGGSDKGTSFDQLGEALARRARAVVCIGETAPAIARAVERASQALPRKPTIIQPEDFPAAMNSARARAVPGDVVLLSPACASFDWFRNYEQRGDQFRTIVRQWAAVG